MTLTARDLATATRRSAVSLTSDPAVRFYAPDTIALVHERTVLAIAGAGSIDAITERLAADPELSEVPADVVDAIAAASYRHFIEALASAGGGT